ncbi:hypothetical protein [Natrinema pallidum]|uniref:Uncharacterized protein n=1 Tax=Natrinema pallidum DSM 3751 TaxID=1227495 RepID=L9Z114_9EURY|nr:hypothetical protein [Natrinema pallidum]ELY80200.1 hypothetical protein C487_05034 [Natrinema pallidum DSM 3751]
MYDIENARRRDGDAAEDRSDRVDEILSRPRLGYEESDPLPESFEDYDEYPEQPDDLTTPEARQFVTELFASDLVNSIDDAIAETTPATGDSQIVREWREAFLKAVELFGGESPEGGDERNENDADSRLAELTGDYPDDMVTPSNPLVVGRLYAGLGLSTDEIADVFSDESDRRVKPDQIRATLRNTGLITATENEDSDPSHKLGGTSLNFSESGDVGANINSEAVARDPTISVERDE